MDKRKRILVVEDIDTHRASYIENLKIEDYYADGAANLTEAIDRLQASSYHAAVVDIMLGGEKNLSNRDGVKVLEHIRRLDEGTQPVVVSRQDELQLVRDFLKEYGAFDYLDKKELGEHGISVLLSMIQRAVASSRLSKPPSWDEVVRPFAWATSEARFVSDCLGRLDFKGGFENLSRCLIAVAQYLLPLLVSRNAGQGMRYDETVGVFRGQYWSKGQGRAIEVLLLGGKTPESVLGQISGAGRPVLDTRERAGLSVVILDLPDAQRADFGESDSRAH